MIMKKAKKIIFVCLGILVLLFVGFSIGYIVFDSGPGIYLESKSKELIRLDNLQLIFILGMGYAIYLVLKFVHTATNYLDHKREKSKSGSFVKDIAEMQRTIDSLENDLTCIFFHLTKTPSNKQVLTPASDNPNVKFIISEIIKLKSLNEKKA